jgi:hypothetical protein
VVADTSNIIDDGCIAVGNGQPVDVVTFGGTWTLAYVNETLSTKLCGLKA